MGEPTSYVDGDYGCVGDPFGVRLSNGDANLDFVADCGHLFLDEKGDNHGPLFSPEMIEFLDSLRG